MNRTILVGAETAFSNAKNIKEFMMWGNYLKIMARNVRKNIGYTTINLVGLAIGLACCLLIFLWVQDELSFDRFHENKAQLYCVIRQEVDAKDETGNVVVPFALAPILKKEFPEILDFSRYQERGWLESPVISYGGNTFYESGMSLVDPSFLRMFSFALLKGDPRTALQGINSVVITEALAKKYFGTEEPLGKVLKYNNRMDLTVTAVLKNIPANSNLQFDLLAPMRMLGEQKLNGWSWESLSYLLLKPHTRLAEICGKLAGSMTKYCPEGGKKWKINLLPITKFHLQQGGGDRKLVTIFSSIAIFILLIACMNYMNLATARSARRAREVGLRKMAGARRGQLVRQFLGETLLLTILAASLALLLVFISLGPFNHLTQKQLSLNIFNNPPLLLGLLALVLMVSLASGSYPAFFLSAYKPVQVLKGSVLHGSRGAVFRKIMVIGQFAISIVLLIGTLVIRQQLHYIRNKDMGWNREQVVILPVNDELAKQFHSLKQELRQNPKILAVTVASSIPTRIGQVNGIDWWEGKSPADKAIFRFVIGEYDYLDTFGMKLKEGRNFSRSRPTDISNFIVNEEAVKLMKLENPVGKGITYMNVQGQIIGVVKDFIFRHISEPIGPLVLLIHPRHHEYFHRFVFAKIRPGGIKKTLNYIRGVCRRLAPHFPFEYKFLDEEFNRLYLSEGTVSRMVDSFTLLALFIACLGLFGLASFMTEQRKKEIGVRKVLGSSASRIVLLFIREFYKWVLLASVIACPIAYSAMSQWLNDYAFHIPLLWWPFALACLLTFLVAGITVSYQSVRAAHINPVETLRSE
jgi:putative ABC transport system permease protein